PRAGVDPRRRGAAGRCARADRRVARRDGCDDRSAHDSSAGADDDRVPAAETPPPQATEADTRRATQSRLTHGDVTVSYRAIRIACLIAVIALALWWGGHGIAPRVLP